MPTPIAGRYFSGRSSPPLDIEFDIGRDHRVRLHGLTELREYPLAEVQFSVRIGRTPRILTFPDGSSCETADNEGVDEALAALDAHSLEHGVRLLESRWTYALGAAFVLVIAIWAGSEFGIPALAHQVAFALPASTDHAHGEQSLVALDKTLFRPTGLVPARQQQLQAQFRSMVDELDTGHGFRLELRGGGGLGANAFALPSGIVVMTDELVALAANDHELTAVLAHELGHVVERHSLRMLLQDSATTLLTIAVFGDGSESTPLIAVVPTALVQMKHSRAFESEADDFAYDWLDRHRIPRRHFATMLERLEKEDGEGDDGMGSWVSSHPQTAERLRE
jgi:Zn-dependent protease with chaperone function